MAYLHRSSPSPTALARIAETFGVETRDFIDVPADVWLNDLRAYAGLTVAALAERVHLSTDYTGVVARGELPVADPKLWAEALGVSEREVLDAWANSRRHLKEG